MEYKLDILATRQATTKVIDTFLDWCIVRNNLTSCCDCPYEKTCDNLENIRDELLKMK